MKTLRVYFHNKKCIFTYNLSLRFSLGNLFKAKKFLRGTGFIFSLEYVLNEFAIPNLILICTSKFLFNTSLC